MEASKSIGPEKMNIFRDSFQRPQTIRPPQACPAEQGLTMAHAPLQEVRTKPRPLRKRNTNLNQFHSHLTTFWREALNCGGTRPPGATQAVQPRALPPF